MAGPTRPVKHRRPHQAPEHAEIDLAAGLRHLIAKEVREEVAKQLAAARSSPVSDGLLSVAQVAERLGMSIGFVRAAVRDGRLPSERIGRAVRVRAAALAVLMQTNRQKAIVDPTGQAERILGLGRSKR